jgi:GTP cyclohydrolase II
MLILKDEDFIAKGNERACYLHPDDNNKTIKVTYENNIRKKSKQSEKEIKYYKELQSRGIKNWKHLPEYFGEVKTNKGDGFVLELVKDYDGEVSKSFAYYLKENGIETYQKELEDYREYFLENCIIFWMQITVSFSTFCYK